ncbi:type III secretion system effector HopM1 [Pseudomonas viridiflava]|uniref:type III secretion system effector HopM1 n=1 Tax=Pseudomonas syringae group TaxID=136849 RepID=UPI000F0716DE|nr:type III secretion system effector HopM1 [Pseudomonas viridiflava]
MISSRIGGAGGVELSPANQQHDTVPAQTAHPNAVTAGMNPPLTLEQSGSHAGESSTTGAARLNVAARHTQLLQAFKAEHGTAPVSGAPMISSRAALLIGSLLQAEPLPFEVMAEKLSPERYQLKQFQGSDLQQRLEKFAQPGQIPDKAEVGQLIKGFAQSVADQLEHFQLMHDASPATVGQHAKADKATLAVSQTALGEYAGRASKAIGEGLSNSIASLDEHISALDLTLQDAEQGNKESLHADRQALVDAKTTLVGLHADFVKSPEAKRLASVAAHTQLDNVVSDLVTARNTVGGWKGAGPIVAAAVPQFLSSMTHLGYVRLSTSDKLRDTIPETSSDANMLKASIIGMVAGIAHETVNSVVKPMFQAALQKTGLNERLNMVPMKAVDTNTVIPDPFELKSEHGELVKKTPEEVAQDKAFVKSERALLNQKKVQGSSTHPVGELMAYSAFGGSQAVRQMLNDVHQINGQTLSARALASGFGGAVSASSQTLLQLKSNYVDPQGRKIPVFTPDRAESDLKKDLLKGMDLREPSVRTTFYSKALSGIQSSALTSALPPVTAQAEGASGTLSAGAILRNMALAATGSVSYLSTLYTNQSVTAEAKALKAAGMGGATPMLDRTETALNNIRHPNRESLPHTFQKSTLSGIPRVAENAYHMGRGALQLPTQMAVDTVRVVDEGVLNAVASAREALKQPTKDDDQLRALEEGLLDPR